MNRVGQIQQLFAQPLEIGDHAEYPYAARA